jgi:hypothetical protein
LTFVLAPNATSQAANAPPACFPYPATLQVLLSICSAKIPQFRAVLYRTNPGLVQFPDPASTSPTSHRRSTYLSAAPPLTAPGTTYPFQTLPAPYRIVPYCTVRHFRLFPIPSTIYRIRTEIPGGRGGNSAVTASVTKRLRSADPIVFNAGSSKLRMVAMFSRHIPPPPLSA